MNRMTELFVLRSYGERPFNFTDQYCLAHTNRTDQMQLLLSIYASSYMVKLEPLNSICCCQGTGIKCQCNFSWGCLWGKSSKRWCEWKGRKICWWSEYAVFITFTVCMKTAKIRLWSHFTYCDTFRAEIYISSEVQMKLVVSCRIDVSLEWF